MPLGARVQNPQDRLQHPTGRNGFATRLPRKRTSARRLWELVHRPIGHALAELDGGPHEFRLGGDTALAARWHHRDSFDIDLVVDRTVPLRELANPSNPFDLTMRALGGTPEYLRRQ